MKVAVIEVVEDDLKALVASGNSFDYNLVEVFEKGFKDDPEYHKLVAKKKELYAEFTKSSKEIEKEIDQLRDQYNG